MRNLVACPGSYRCDSALVNAPEVAYVLGQAAIDDQQYPGLPNSKTAVSGCPNDCKVSQMEKDLRFGVFRGAPAVTGSLTGVEFARHLASF